MASYRPFVCSICLNAYRDPKILSCFHSFCLQCLKDCFERPNAQSIKCPLCRHLTPMPEEGINGLSNNIYLEPTPGPSREGKGKIYCGFCCSNFVAEFRCRDCVDYLCIRCKEQHVHMKQTKAHILEIVEEEPKQVQTETEMCTIHPDKELLFGCFTCIKECCSECWKISHQKHNVGPLTEVAEVMRGTIQECIEKSKAHLYGIVSEQRDILLEEDKVKTLLDATDATIDRITCQLKERIDSVSANIRRELRETSDVMNEKIQANLEANELKNKSITSAIESTTEILNSTRNTDVLKLGKDVKEHLLEEIRSTALKKIQAQNCVAPNIERAFLTSLRDGTDIPADNILHPTIDSKVLGSINVKKGNISAITCLENGCILICNRHQKRVHQRSLGGDSLGSFNVPFRVEGVVQLADGSILITKYRGKRVAKFWLEGNYVDNNKIEGYTMGVALTYDSNHMILCCNDILEDTRNKQANARLLIMNPTLAIQALLKIPSGGEIVRRACQNRNGDFVAVTAKRCFVVTNTGVLKFIYKLHGIIDSVCTDKYGNIILLHEMEAVKLVSLFDANLNRLKGLYKFRYGSPEAIKCSMAQDNDGYLWISVLDRIGRIQYAL